MGVLTEIKPNDSESIACESNSIFIDTQLYYRPLQIGNWLGHWLCKLVTIGLGTELLCWSDDADTYGFKAQSNISGAIGHPVPTRGRAPREHDKSSPALKCPWASNPCLDQCVSDRSRTGALRDALATPLVPVATSYSKGFLLAGCDSSKCHRSRSEMPGLYHSSFREREKEDVKDIYFCSFYIFFITVQLYPIQSFSLCLYTQRLSSLVLLCSSQWGRQDYLEISSLHRLKSTIVLT